MIIVTATGEEGRRQALVAGRGRVLHEAVQPARPAPDSGAGASRFRVAGIVTVKVAPSPRSDSRSIQPPIASASCRAM